MRALSQHPSIAQPKTAQLFFKYVVKYWGMPQDIVSDQDSHFTGNFWIKLFKLFGSQLSTSSSYHPESDGQTERFNSMLEEYLRHFVSATQKNWVKLLDVAQLCFNSCKSSSIEKSAFEIINGQQPLLPHTVNVSNTGKSPRAISFSKEWRQNIDLTHSYLEKAARRMKKHADKNRHSRPSKGQIRRQGLKPKAAGKRVAEAILNDRVITASRKRHQEYLVKWQGYMEEENTWERPADLSAYTDKMEAYHIQKLTRASTALVGENVMGCPCTHPTQRPRAHPAQRPCALTSSSNWLADSSCERQVECHTVSLCHQGPPCVRWYQSAVAQGTVASAKKILWDSLLSKTMANTKERIDALEAQIHDMFKSDQDAPGILKQFSLRLDALEVNLKATDNTRYAESMEWEGKFQEL
ncbi:hypothetical protein RJ639_041167 [Escallonia herrerae]|uniref:Reverse transcriptase n=1 Tax=Escallonia herrerae TaxID=1293975 RepID=A0AA88WG31_9ASTE|nr:hypothetical protein RJ639_041167 [Escallonia herrerae]